MPPQDARLFGADATEPQRLCVGCRERGGRSVLLRVVAEQVDGRWIVQPDPGRRRPGRGAWVHPDQACVGVAVRRSGFSRALRVRAGMDPQALASYVASTDRVETDRGAGR